MSDEGARFVKEVMRRVGAATPTELSKRMGEPWTQRDPQRKLYKWHAGESDPNFTGTLALLRVGGMLSESEGPASPLPQTQQAPEGLDVRLEELRTIVERQGRATTRTLKALEAQLSHIRGLLEPPTREANEGQ